MKNGNEARRIAKEALETLDGVLTMWEVNFLRGIVNWKPALTTKQINMTERIVNRALQLLDKDSTKKSDEE